MSPTTIFDAPLTHMSETPAVFLIPNVHSSLDETLGAILIGVVLAAILHGLTAGQALNYYQNSENDPASMKYLVILLWLIDSVQLAFLVHALYFYAVSNFGNLEALLRPSWSIISTLPVTSMNDLIISISYAYWIWKVDKNWAIITMIVVSIVISLVASSATAALCSTRTFEQMTHQFRYLWSLANGGQAVADVTITFHIIFIFRRGQPMVRRSGIKNVLRILTLYFVNTCVLTSSCAIAIMITYATMPNNLIFLGICPLKSKLMLNSMLALLNSRQSLKKIIRIGEHERVTDSLTGLRTTEENLSTVVVNGMIYDTS